MLEGWWDSLDTALRIFYSIGIGSGLFLVLQLIGAVFGFGGDELEADADTGDVSVLSVRSITAFFVGFGWTGAALLREGTGVFLATAGGALVGGTFLAAVVLLMRLLYGMQSSGTVHYENAIGSIARVYVPIAAEMKSAGKIEITVQGRLRVVDALTQARERLESNRRVRVVEVVDPSTLLVEPLEAEAETG